MILEFSALTSQRSLNNPRDTSTTPLRDFNKRAKEPSSNKNETSPARHWNRTKYFQRSSSMKKHLKNERLLNIYSTVAPGPSQVKTWFTTTTSEVGEDFEVFSSIFSSVVDFMVYSNNENCNSFAWPFKYRVFHKWKLLWVKILLLFVNIPF